MRVLFVSYEVYPFAKVGGLADVAGSLPKALRELGVDIDVLMPYHGSVNPANIEPMHRTYSTTFTRKKFDFQLHASKLPGSKVSLFLLANDSLMDSKEIYGPSDLGLQAMAFSDAAVSFALERGYDLVHLNDWHTGLMAVYLAQSHSRAGTLISIHNLAYQGDYPREYFALSGIERSRRAAVSRGGNLNFLKAGIVFSDTINTVSPTYAREIQTREYGAGLDRILSERSKDLLGIVNGIDYREYDPATDPRLWARFDSRNLDGKATNREKLRDLLGLEHGEEPVIALISRLVDQKGLDLIEEVKEDLLALPIQLVVLGTGEKKYEEMFAKLEREHPGRVAAELTFDLDLAQKIYGGADLFLMPSRYEPCGLGQLFAMRYGTIPLVRYTGGLADTVKEFDPKGFTGNGFGFCEYDSGRLIETVERALKVYRAEKLWKRVIENAMNQDFSWKSSARKYLATYEKIMEEKRDA